MVEAAYVGNRGAWWLSTVLDNYNALTPQMLWPPGLDINNAADRAILRAQIGSTAAGRFQNKLPYAGFPTTSTVAQSLRPFPQFTSGLAPLWAPQGHTWYDSLQAKVTKRFSHGLEASVRLHLGQGGTTRNRRAARSTTYSTGTQNKTHLRLLASAGERNFGQLPRSRAGGEQDRFPGRARLGHRDRC